MRRRKGLIAFAIVLLCTISFITYAYIQYKKEYPGEKTDFASIEEFQQYKGAVSLEIPESATDMRYYANRSIFQFESIYSFVVSDEEEFDALMEELSHRFPTDKESYSAKPHWEKIGDQVGYKVEYTDEELEEMAYVADHWEEMSYKEILSMSDHTYGFIFGYGAKVGDYIDIRDTRYTHSDSTPYTFPMQDCFSYVMDGDLANCTIITYDSFDGSHDGIIVDVENRRIIEFVYSVW